MQFKNDAEALEFARKFFIERNFDKTKTDNWLREMQDAEKEILPAEYKEFLHNKLKSLMKDHILPNIEVFRRLNNQ